MTTEEEITLLQERGFCPEEMNASMLIDNFHSEKIWADAFWRRRRQHAQRIDPELIFLQQRNVENFDQVLEIGAAYGRVSVKLEQMDHIGMVTCCEICQDMEPHSIEYIKQNDHIQFIYEDFFTTTKLQDHSFDLVIVPMNTLPSFPPDQLAKLLERVHQVLKPRGIFLFTTYQEREEPREEEQYEGELLVELDEDPLAIEYYTLPETHKDEGIESVTYAKVRYLQEDTTTTDAQYIRLGFHNYRHDYLREVLEQHHLPVIFHKKIEHSTVIVGEAQ